MNPIWAVALVTLSLSMNGATGRPSDFSRSLCGVCSRWQLRQRSPPGPGGLEGHCPSRKRKRSSRATTEQTTPHRVSSRKLAVAGREPLGGSPGRPLGVQGHAQEGGVEGTGRA